PALRQRTPRRIGGHGQGGLQRGDRGLVVRRFVRLHGHEQEADRRRERRGCRIDGRRGRRLLWWGDVGNSAAGRLEDEQGGHEPGEHDQRIPRDATVRGGLAPDGIHALRNLVERRDRATREGVLVL